MGTFRHKQQYEVASISDLTNEDDNSTNAALAKMVRKVLLAVDLGKHIFGMSLLCFPWRTTPKHIQFSLALIIF